MLRRGSGPPPVGSGAGSRRPFADRGGEAQRHGSSDPARLGASLQRRGRGGSEVALEPGSGAGFERAAEGRVARAGDQGSRSGAPQGGALALRGSEGRGRAPVFGGGA